MACRCLLLAAPPPPPAAATCPHARPVSQAVEGKPSAAALAARAGVHNKMKSYMEAVADASEATEMNGELAAAHREKGCVWAVW